MTNYISNRKVFALIDENNFKAVQQSIACKNYTYVFTGLKIALSKKFKANVLNNSCFISHFLLLAFDEIYLIEE